MQAQKQKAEKQDVKRNYYNRNLKFVRYPNLPWMEQVSLMKTLMLIVALVVFLMRLSTNTPTLPMLMGFSVGFTLMWAFFRFWHVPRIFTGKAEAYYRRDYSKIYSVKLLDDIVSATLGILMANIAYFTHRYYVEQTSDAIWKLIFSIHPIGVLIGAAVVGIFFFLIFMQDKYVTVREYSNLYNYFKKTEKFSDNECHRQVMMVKDKHHEIYEYEGSYLNEDEIQEVIEETTREANQVRRKKRY